MGLKRILRESIEHELTINEIVNYIKSFGQKGKLPANEYNVYTYSMPFLQQAFEWCRDNGNSATSKVSTYGMDYFVSNWKAVINRFRFNSKGLIYVERDIDLQPGNMDKYKSLGECWSWKRGNGNAYCSDDLIHSKSVKVKICGYVHPESVDWLETIYLNSYRMSHETEIRMDNDALVEVGYIFINGNKVSLGGSYLINASADKYDKGVAKENELSWNEFDKQVQQDHYNMSEKEKYDFSGAENSSINTDKRFDSGSLAMDALENPDGYGASFTSDHDADIMKWMPFKRKMKKC